MARETITLKDLTIGYKTKGTDKKIVASGINAILFGGELT